MASFVQAEGNAAGGVNSIQVTLESVVVGNTIVVAFRHGNTTTDLSVSDDQGNTYTERRREVNAGALASELWTAPVTTGGTVVVTATSADLGTFHVIAAEFSGLDNSDLVDVTNGANTDAATSHPSGDLTTTDADVLLVSWFACSADATITVPTNFTAVTGTGVPTTRSQVAYREVSATDTYSATWTTAASTDSACIHIALREATGAPPPLAFDAEIESVRTGTTDPMTWTHTPVGTPRGIVVAIVHGTSATDHVVGVTYGGVAMTRVRRATDTATEPGAAELWFLGSGIPTGAQTVSVDLATATTDDIHGISWSLTGGADTEVIDDDAISENAANPVVTLQKNGRTGWCVAAMYAGGAAPGGTIQTGNTQSHNHDLGAFYSDSVRETTIDSADHTIGWSTLTSDDLAFVALCVAEVIPGKTRRLIRSQAVHRGSAW